LEALLNNETCGVDEARTHLPELVDRAKAGTITIITRRGLPMAALVPLDVAASAAARPRSFLALAGSGAGLYNAARATDVASQRDEWR
jgi:prevent-host-death family protein